MQIFIHCKTTLHVSGVTARVQFLILLMMGAVTPEICRVVLQWINIWTLLHLLDFYFHNSLRIMWKEGSWPTLKVLLHKWTWERLRKITKNSYHDRPSRNHLLTRGWFICHKTPQPHHVTTHDVTNRWLSPSNHSCDYP